jgi:hypothetical protein
VEQGGGLRHGQSSAWRGEQNRAGSADTVGTDVLRMNGGSIGVGRDDVQCIEARCGIGRDPFSSAKSRGSRFISQRYYPVLE